MTIFGIGPFELLIIIVIALVVVGPERLPEMMFQIGQGVTKVKRMILDLRDQARSELGEDYESFEQMTRQIRDLDPRRQIQELGRSLLDDSSSATKIDLPNTAVVVPLPQRNTALLARTMLDDELLDAPLAQTLNDNDQLLTSLLNQTPSANGASSTLATTTGQEREHYG